MPSAKSPQDQMNSNSKVLPCRLFSRHRSKKEAIEQSPTLLNSSKALSAEKCKPRLQSTKAESNPGSQQPPDSGRRIVDYDALLSTIHNIPTEPSSVVKAPLPNGTKESTVGSTSPINLGSVEATSNGDIRYASVISSDTSEEIPKGSIIDNKSLIKKPHSTSLHYIHERLDQLDSQATYLAKEVADSQSDKEVISKVSTLLVEVKEMRSIMANFDIRLSLVETKYQKMGLSEAAKNKDSKSSVKVKKLQRKKIVLGKSIPASPARQVPFTY